MNEWLNQSLLSGRDFRDVLFTLALATVMGLLISRIYKWTHRGLNYEHTFMASLVLLAPIISVVMLYIRGDLVLSLGLIGSLSIIRFRTPIKDTRDMVFLFWVIAIGLGAGTFNWAIVVISTPIIAVVVALLYFFRYGNSPNNDFVLVISGRGAYQREKSEEIIKHFCNDYRVRSFDVEGDIWEIIFEIRLQKNQAFTADGLVTELRSIEEIVKVSLLAPQLALPL